MCSGSSWSKRSLTTPASWHFVCEAPALGCLLEGRTDPNHFKPGRSWLESIRRSIRVCQRDDIRAVPLPPDRVRLPVPEGVSHPPSGEQDVINAGTVQLMVDVKHHEVVTGDGLIG